MRACPSALQRTMQMNCEGSARNRQIFKGKCTVIGRRIQLLRREKQLSLSELSRRANVAKSYLSAIERNVQTNPSLQVIERISRVLDVPVQSLVTQDGEMSYLK